MGGLLFPPPPPDSVPPPPSSPGPSKQATSPPAGTPNGTETTRIHTAGRCQAQAAPKTAKQTRLVARPVRSTPLALPCKARQRTEKAPRGGQGPGRECAQYIVADDPRQRARTHRTASSPRGASSQPNRKVERHKTRGTTSRDHTLEGEPRWHDWSCGGQPIGPAA